MNRPRLLDLAGGIVILDSSAYERLAGRAIYIGTNGYAYFSTWRAQITVNRRNIHLGLFPTKEAATAARRAAELKYYGEECPHV